jgi:putative aldouronate transport system permease protein
MVAIHRRSLGEHVFDTFNIAFMFLMMFLTLYPFYYVLCASLSAPSELVRARGFIFSPQGFSADAYQMVFDNEMIRIGYINTIIYVVAGTSLNLLLTSFGAYALSRRNLEGKNFFMFAIVFTMFFSGGLIPTFLIVKSLGLIDSRLALIVIPAISTWNLIIMRTGFQSVPVSLEESAKMDGANDLVILFRIYFPVSLPVVAVMILFYSVYHWNAFFNAMIYIRTRTLYPLQLILREILIASSTDNMMSASGIVSDREPIGETIKYATVIVTTVPILLAYPFLQRYFIKGVMVGAIKE